MKDVKNIFPAFSKWCKFYDLFAENKTSLVNKILKVAMYPFAIIALAIIWLIVLSVCAEVKSKSYKYNGKYKRVVKEGMLFTTYEYHEI